MRTFKNKHTGKEEKRIQAEMFGPNHIAFKDHNFVLPDKIGHTTVAIMNLEGHIVKLDPRLEGFETYSTELTTTELTIGEIQYISGIGELIQENIRNGNPIYKWIEKEVRGIKEAVE